MSDDAEVDMKDVELNEVDPERQPMTTGNGDASPAVALQNGIVKVKIPDEKESKFTGLSKEELLKVAGTPGWVRARWALLILFWLGWLGMLAGAIVIIVQAPRCKPLPEMNWWDHGALYQIGDVEAFTESPGLKGLEAKVGALGQLKVKGLIVGPLDASTSDGPGNLVLTDGATSAGNLSDLESLVRAAHKKGISVVLDLTPNNTTGSEPWYAKASLPNTAEKIKVEADYWLKKGVDGILLYDFEHLFHRVPSVWASIRETVGNHSEEEKKKVLIGVTQETSPEEVNSLLQQTGVDLLLSGVLRNKAGEAVGQVVQKLYPQNRTRLAWNMGDRVKGHLASIVGSVSVKMHQLLLFTLPGTPVFNYGDEIGLTDENTVYPKMLWDSPGKNETEPEVVQRNSLRTFFKSVSELRGKERSLLHGDYVPLYNSTSALAYMRSWDQSERYVAAFNWSPKDAATLHLVHETLPEKATVVASTDREGVQQSVDLARLELGPQQAVLLKFPYTA